MKLQINQDFEIPIYAKYKWNSTKLEISENEEYEFTATGQWKDLFIDSDANGYTNLYMRLFDTFKRAKNEKWFSLMGSLKAENQFFIGNYNKIAFTKSGILDCFANDVDGFYFNNSGYITLLLTRLK